MGEYIISSVIIKPMELSGSSEWMSKPEFTRQPDELFSYACQKQRWLRERVSTEQLPMAVDNLVHELNTYLSSEIGTMPELIVSSRDIHHTKEVAGEGPLIFIETGSLPLEGDAAMYNEHTIRGALYGFHRGLENDLRVYVTTDEAPRQFMGGTWTPLLSVGIESSEINLAETVEAEQIDELIKIIDDQVNEYPLDVGHMTRELIEEISNNQYSSIKKLRHASAILARIARQPEPSIPFIDRITELIRLRLHLDEPHDIHTSAYRAVISEQPASYKARGEAYFEKVTPQLGLIGETGSKGLGLFFLYDNAPMQVPVQYITHISPSGNEYGR